MDADIHQRDSLPAARELGETSLMFLVHPTLSEKDMTAVADAAENILAEANL
jgi:dTDP-4-amino-4,6-dideoxygalactose transaminase